MRLKRLRLRNYGCFADLDLELAAEPGRITLITAPNGAGKSVLRQAFHDLLFDIPIQSPMKFRHGYAGMALHADAQMADGTQFSFGWERGAKPHQRITSDAAAFGALRNWVSPQQLETLFALDTARLRKGGTDLKGGATLSEALIAGTGELASAKAVRSVIEARSNEHWGKGRSKPPLNAAASRLEETRKQVRDAIVRPEVREQAERRLVERAQALATARTERDIATVEIRRLNRIALTRPHLEALAEAEKWLASNLDAPALPADRQDALAAAREQAVLAGTRLIDAGLVLKRTTEVVAGITRDEACTALADRLAALPGLLGASDKASMEIAGLRTEHAAKMESIRAVLRAIGSDIPADRAAEVLPTVGLKADLLAAITGEAKLRTAIELAQTGVAKAEAAITKAESEPTIVAPLPEVLGALLAEIRADRNPVTHAEELEADLSDKVAEVRRCLALTPGWTGTAEALREVTPPPDVEFERLDTERAAAVREAEKTRSRRIELATQDSEARSALAKLRQSALPDTASVLAARAERDRGMELVLARAFGVPPSPAEEVAFAGAESMSVAYERRVRNADALADRRAEELERVQEAERLGRAIEDAVKPLRDASGLEAAALETLASAEQAWSDAVAPLGLSPHTTIGGLRQACDARRSVVDALARLETASAAQASVIRRHVAWAERLAACLDLQPTALGSMLAAADERVSAARKAEQAVTKRQTALDAARLTLPDATETLAKATAALGCWKEDWVALLGRLGRPTDESPAAVTANLEQFTLLEKHHQDAEGLAGRICRIEADLEQFAETVSVLALEIGQPQGTTASETARNLIVRAAAASQTEALWSQAQQSRHSAAQTEAEANAAAHAIQAKLDAVIASCGAKDAETAEARIAASRLYADQVQRRDAARVMLLEHGDGLSPVMLRTEADAVPVDAMSSRRQAAEEAAAAAQGRAEEASVALNTTQTELNLASASTSAMEARADYEASIAVFDRLLEDQLVFHLASTMLGNAMREVEDTIGGSVLDRISATFSAVTDDAFTLNVHDGPVGEELFAIERAFPGECKALAELSEGSRDQLYLALRMEALRSHCQSTMAVPFIADDILQTFDNRRATATLRALCELSADLQVIVLTHHLHLQSLAETLGVDLVRLIEL